LYLSSEISILRIIKWGEKRVEVTCLISYESKDGSGESQRIGLGGEYVSSATTMQSTRAIGADGRVTLVGVFCDYFYR
jgi:hypothetical protein